MAALIAVLLVAGCDRGDPRWAPYRDARDAWQVGVSALEAGDPEEARVAFARARELDPDDPVLAAWEARALAADDRLVEAIAALDEALAANPGLSEARYNRAAYAARLGWLEAAAQDLERALAEGVRAPRDVLEDPDFRPHLGHEAFAFLPDAPLLVGVEAPDGAVFWGSEFDLRLRIAGAESAAIGVTAERARGPAALVRVVEDSTASTQGPLRDLTWTFRVLGPGEVDLGPFHVWIGERRATVDPVRVTALAPPGREAPPEPPAGIRLTTPGEVTRALTPPARWTHDGDLYVLLAPGDRVDLSPPPAAPPIDFERRSAGQPVWTVKTWTGAGAPDVRVRRADGEIRVLPP